MLLIDKLTKIVHLKSATAIMNVKKDGFYVQGHFPGQPVMPGVLIVEAFGQAAAALTAWRTATMSTHMRAGWRAPARPSIAGVGSPPPRALRAQSSTFAVNVSERHF